MHLLSNYNSPDRISSFVIHSDLTFGGNTMMGRERKTKVECGEEEGGNLNENGILESNGSTVGRRKDNDEEEDSSSFRLLSFHLIFTTTKSCRRNRFPVHIDLVIHIKSFPHRGDSHSFSPLPALHKRNLFY